MNEAIRRTWLVMVGMFLVLAVAASVIQVVAAEPLKDHRLNSRQMVLEFGAPRGPILVEGEPIAESVESGDAYTYQRVYHDSPLWAPLTGYYSLVYTTDGLEKALDDQLAGTSSSQFLDRAVQIVTGATPEGDQVELTLDRALQELAYNAIPDGTKGSVVVAEPATGRILAMASKPSFDANALSSHSRTEAVRAMNEYVSTPGLDVQRNRAAEQRVSPGSTFKLVDLVAMLESGDYAPDQVLEVPETWTLPGTTAQMSNFAGGPCNDVGSATLTWILAHSCNTPFAQAAVELGQDRIRETAERFGFNDSGEIPLPVTESVFPEDLDDAALAQSAIGQRDVQATALQMTMVTMGIANGGVVMEPEMVETVRRPDLTVVSEFAPRERGRAMDEDVAEQIAGMMEATVQEGTASAARSDALRIAAKTGTAEKDGSENVNTWVTGFAPVEDPQVAVTVVYEDQNEDSAHSTAVESMQRIMEAVVVE